MRWVNISVVVIAVMLTLSGCMRWFSPFNRADADIVVQTRSIDTPRGVGGCPELVAVNMGRGRNGARCVDLLFSDGNVQTWCADEMEARK